MLYQSEPREEIEKKCSADPNSNGFVCHNSGEEEEEEEVNEGTDRRSKMAKSFHIGNEPPPLTDRPTDDFTELIEGTASLDIYKLCSYKTNNRPTEILFLVA